MSSELVSSSVSESGLVSGSVSLSLLDSLDVRSTLLSSFENSAKSFAIKCIRECGEHHGFDVDSELERLGLIKIKAKGIAPKKKEVKLDENGEKIKVSRKKKVETGEAKKKSKSKKSDDNITVTSNEESKSVDTEEKLTRVRVDGKQYLKNKSNVLFDVSTKEKVGIFNEGKIESFDVMRLMELNA
jgi:hypothetical protein